MLKKQEIIEFVKEVIKEKDNTIKDLIRINENAVRQLNEVVYEFRKYIEKQGNQDVKDKR